MPVRRSASLPLPGDELLRMKEYLSPHYGSQLWQDGEQRILVLRVPGEDPDMVNDVESSIEHLSPGDVHDLQGVLLVGNRSTVMTSVQPFRDLMQARIQSDRSHCRQARARLTGKQDHLLYRSQDDSRRLWRLAIRIQRPRVADLDDQELERISDSLGPLLRKPGYAEVQVVYLIADQDDVRIDAALFLQDIRDRHDDEERQARRLEEERARLERERQHKLAEREKLLRDIEAKLPRRERVASAPLRSMAPSTWQAEEGASALARATNPSQRSATRPSDAGDSSTVSTRRAMYEHLDGLPLRPGPTPAARPPAAQGGASPASVMGSAQASEIASTNQAPRGSLTLQEPAEQHGARVGASSLAPQESIQAPAASRPFPACLSALSQELEKFGFEVLRSPDVGHVIDLAAEREGTYPQRVIVRYEQKADEGVAGELLHTAKDVEADLALLVAPVISPEGTKRLIATKAKHLRPDDIASLAL